MVGFTAAVVTWTCLRGVGLAVASDVLRRSLLAPKRASLIIGFTLASIGPVIVAKGIGTRLFEEPPWVLLVLSLWVLCGLICAGGWWLMRESWPQFLPSGHVLALPRKAILRWVAFVALYLVMIALLVVGIDDWILSGLGMVAGVSSYLVFTRMLYLPRPIP